MPKRKPVVPHPLVPPRDASVIVTKLIDDALDASAWGDAEAPYRMKEANKAIARLTKKWQAVYSQFFEQFPTQQAWDKSI